MRFRTKVDWWIGLLAAGVPILATVAVVAAVLQSAKDLWILPLFLVVFGLVALICWPCDYTLHEDRLVVRSGLIRFTVPYEKIERVYPTRNPLSSPAWSLDRLAVAYSGRWVMISPKDKGDFLTVLMNRAGLRQRGEELVRPGA